MKAFSYAAWPVTHCAGLASCPCYLDVMLSRDNIDLVQGINNLEV